MKIVIIGFGWVGQANALSLSHMGFDVAFFDPMEPKLHYEKEYASTYKKVQRLTSALVSDSKDTYYIVCVGDKVLPTGEQDITYIRRALESLKSAKGTVILRSTVLPAFLKDLDFDFYVPEFLHEKKAVQESIKPHYFVVGRKTKKPEPPFFKKWRANSYKHFEGTPEEASYIKYLSNIWNSIRIAFINEFGDAISLPKTKEDVEGVERVIDFMFEGKYYMRYGRAFSGHCLPKDTLAFFSYYDNPERPLTLIEGAYKSNDIRVAMQEKHEHLNEWFSAWQKLEFSGREALRHLANAVRRRVFGVFGRSK